jgi:F-type H+-transporting ATPase subunit epsilon
MDEQVSNSFDFELVSPEEKLLSERARMVVVPGEEGDFGVLINHAATVSSIRPGVLEVHSDGDQPPRKIFIAGGFVDVTPSSCTVLAEEAMPVDNLDQPQLEKELQNLSEDLGLAEGDADKEHISYKIKVAKAKLSALTGHTVL